MRGLAGIGLRLAACALGCWLVWRFLRYAAPGLGSMSWAMAIAFSAPLIGVMLARPLYELFAAGARTAKEQALADVQGRYFAHRGIPIDITEDDEEQRWLRVRDVRKLVPGLPRDEVLARLFPERAGAAEPAADFRIRADALAEHLRAARDPAAVRFKVWVEREVLLGSRLRD